MNIAVPFWKNIPILYLTRIGVHWLMELNKLIGTKIIVMFWLEVAIRKDVQVSFHISNNSSLRFRR